MAQYSEEWFYPTGQLATNQRAIVFGPGDDNVVAPIFSDPAMTVPLANPTTTDANGILTFYAADGTYWIWVGPTTGGNGIETTLGASPDNPVLSVNGIAPDGVGNVELTAADVDAQPITTINAAGDLYIGTGDNATTRLPIGAEGEVLTVVAGTASWEPGGGGAVDSVNGQTGVVVLTAADVGAPPTTRTINTQNGLTGGGDLSADRTIEPVYGTTANTVAEGDDTRIVNAIQGTLFDAKGDIIAASAADTPARQAAGADGTVLSANSGTSTGLEYRSLTDDNTVEFTDDRLVLTAGNGVARWYNRTADTLTLVGAWVSAGVAPTGADIIVDVNKNGTTIYTTQANRPTVPATTNGGAISATPDVTSLAAGDYLTVDIDQIGSTIAGGAIMVGIVTRRTL